MPSPSSRWDTWTAIKPNLIFSWFAWQKVSEREKWVSRWTINIWAISAGIHLDTFDAVEMEGSSSNAKKGKIQCIFCTHYSLNFDYYFFGFVIYYLQDWHAKLISFELWFDPAQLWFFFSSHRYDMLLPWCSISSVLKHFKDDIKTRYFLYLNSSVSSECSVN